MTVISKQIVVSEIVQIQTQLPTKPEKYFRLPARKRHSRDALTQGKESKKKVGGEAAANFTCTPLSTHTPHTRRWPRKTWRAGKASC